MEEDRAECVFCGKTDEVAVLIDMKINSVVVNDDCLLEFSDLLKNLFSAKVCLHLKNLIYESCE